MIASRINRTAAVISGDEALDDSEEDNEGVASSKYGATPSIDEMCEFLKEFGDI